MRTYRLTFEALSSLSKVPDAQVIFGSICNIIKQTKGDEALQRYLSSFEDQPIFVHSSMFPCGLLPMIKVGLLSIEEKNKDVFSKEPKDQLQYLSEMKEFKKIQYVTPDIFNKYINTPDFATRIIDLKNDLLNHKITLKDGVLSFDDSSRSIGKRELITHVQTSLNAVDRTEEEKSRGLYYDSTLYYPEHSYFDIYIKTEQLDYVKDIMKYVPYFGFGNRISVGKNSFKLIRLEKVNIKDEDPDYCMLLSKCISDEFDFTDSSYMVDAHIYRGSHYYHSNVVGDITKIVEGSRMRVKENKEYYGTLLKTDNGDVIYHYGIGFVF